MPDRPETSGATVACTVVPVRGLPAAQVTAESYLAHHPCHTFTTLVVDEARGTRAGTVGWEWLGVDHDDFLRMATALDESRLVEALVPLLLKRVLNTSPVVVYLAAGTQVLAPFGEMTVRAAREDILLAARRNAPLPPDNQEPATDDSLDPGFLAAGAGAKPFLDLWSERALEFPTVADRPWPSLVPGLFRHQVLSDPGIAVGYWNLHERELARTGDGGVTASGVPLRFLRFDGYRPEVPWLLTTDHPRRPRVRLSEHPILHELCTTYGRLLRSAGYPDDREYRFGTTADGTAITKPMREVFHRAWLRSRGPQDTTLRRQTESPPPHAFGRDGGHALRQWLASAESPVERGAGLSRLAMWIWSSRTDLQTVFREPLGADTTSFRAWCQVHGGNEGLPGWALPGEPTAPASPRDEFGVNVAGYLTAELGLGEMARVVNRTIEQAGVPSAAVVEEQSLWDSCRTALSPPSSEGPARFPVSLLAVNADYTRLLLDSHPVLGHERYRIGLWAWELEDFPADLHHGFALVDEVWTVSEFCRRAIAEHSTVPVKVIPVPVLDPGPPPRKPRGDRTTFLFAFDFNSTGGRKNPWGVVTAFRRAFGDRTDVRLVIKATNGHLHTAATERLRLLIGTDSRIRLLEQYLSIADLDALYAGSDAYVSLHRSEGFGLTVAEAMIRGLPVIVTDYGGTKEFFDPSAGWAIPYTMTDVGPGWSPYPATGRWADPDLDAAAAAMRMVADDPGQAQRRGAAARAHILRTRSMDAATTWMHTELEAAYATWRAQPAHEEPPSPPLSAARQTLTTPPDPHMPHRMPFAPVLRKLVNRVLANHRSQDRALLAGIVDATEQELADTKQRQAARLAHVEERLARLARQVDRLVGDHDDTVR